jgi:hypothetical protein
MQTAALWVIGLGLWAVALSIAFPSPAYKQDAFFINQSLLQIAEALKR